MISVPLRGVIADGGYRNIIVLVCVISNVPLRGVTARPTKGRSFKKRLILRPLAGCDQFVSGEVFHVPVDLSYVPLRGVMAKMNKSDRPKTGRMHLFHNAGTIITHSAQKEKRNGEKNAAFCGANRAGGVRKKTWDFEILHRKFQLQLLRRAYLM